MRSLKRQKFTILHASTNQEKEIDINKIARFASHPIPLEASLLKLQNFELRVVSQARGKVPLLGNKTNRCAHTFSEKSIRIRILRAWFMGQRRMRETERRNFVVSFRGIRPFLGKYEPRRGWLPSRNKNPLLPSVDSSPPLFLAILYIGPIVYTMSTGFRGCFGDYGLARGIY